MSRASTLGPSIGERSLTRAWRSGWRTGSPSCAAKLNPTGAMTLHIASPVAHPDRIRAGLANLRAAFAVVAPYLVTVPLYGGLWMMACASATLSPAYLTPLDVNRRIAQRAIRDLQYYNGDMHRASFALPNFVRDLVATAQGT